MMTVANQADARLAVANDALRAVQPGWLRYFMQFESVFENNENLTVELPSVYIKNGGQIARVESKLISTTEKWVQLRYTSGATEPERWTVARLTLDFDGRYSFEFTQETPRKLLSIPIPPEEDVSKYYLDNHRAEIEHLAARRAAGHTDFHLHEAPFTMA